MIFKRELRCSRIETFSSSIYSQSFFEGHIHHPWQLSSPGCVYSIPCDLKFVKSPTPVKPIPGETGLSPRMGSFGVIGCAIQLTTVNLSLGHIWSPYCFFFASSAIHYSLCSKLDSIASILLVFFWALHWVLSSLVIINDFTSAELLCTHSLSIINWYWYELDVLSSLLQQTSTAIITNYYCDNCQLPRAIIWQWLS